MTFVPVARGSFRFQVDAAKGNFLGPPINGRANHGSLRPATCMAMAT